jgi:hypothetical protein
MKISYRVVVFFFLTRLPTCSHPAHLLTCPLARPWQGGHEERNALVTLVVCGREKEIRGFRGLT